MPQSIVVVNIRELTVDPEWSNLEPAAPVVDDVPAVISEVVRPINAQDGDLLPVSAFTANPDGTWEPGKRKI